MNNLIKVTILSISLLSGTGAFASTPTEQLGTCLVDSLNGKERKKLAKWIYFSIGSHPEIKSFMSATDANIQESDQYVGKLITKILTVDCPKELYAANKSDPLAIQKAFELVGKVAMQELMTNQDTIKAITNYAAYTDQRKINAILSK
ncbi:hypothetical protein [Moritella sp. F3]|uniref:hypothetical protein n=1 Tax=Moritella sp. F3 TaxID=2718882 RepID=UPI0018E107F9|nr:hypothetical protein [Moritella sp. F3]GIC76922.1 hypothetical protein FMO001_16490 [Moritella sp. F1]GIC80105.1 hypothetical protein FMO003_03860 [Moritella sp. F3]